MCVCVYLEIISNHCLALLYHLFCIQPINYSSARRVAFSVSVLTIGKGQVRDTLEVSGVCTWIETQGDGV